MTNSLGSLAWNYTEYTTLITALLATLIDSPITTAGTASLSY